MERNICLGTSILYYTCSEIKRDGQDMSTECSTKNFALSVDFQLSNTRLHTTIAMYNTVLAGSLPGIVSLYLYIVYLVDQINVQFAI